MKKMTTQFLSVSLSLALVASGTPMSASAAGPMAPAFAAQLAPKADMGYVASSYAPGNEVKPRLVVIADLHAHLDVQRNIMGIMNDLLPKIRKEGQKVPVFLEGGWEAGLEEPLRNLPVQEARPFLREYFLYKAELSGPQAFSENIAGSNQVSMIGVENKEEYLANKAIFARSYPARKQVLEAIKLQESSMKILEKYVQARGYENLKKMRDAYTAGRVSGERFAKMLVKQANRYHVTGSDVDTLKAISTASPDQAEVAMSSVYRQVSERLSDKRPLMSYLRPSINKESTIRKNMAILNSDLDLLKRLVSNQLSPSEVSLAYSRIVELEKAAKLLVSDLPLTVDVSNVVRESLEFYPVAVLRDETLVKNSLANLEKAGSDATGILVAGGFHTDSIATFLQKRKIAYVLIHPVVSREMTTQEQLNYVKRLSDDHVTLTELEKDVKALSSGLKIAMNNSEASVTFTGLQTPAVKGTNSVDPQGGNNSGPQGFGGKFGKEVLARIAAGGETMREAMREQFLDPDAKAVKGEGLTLTHNGQGWSVKGAPVDQANRFTMLADRISKAIPTNNALSDLPVVTVDDEVMAKDYQNSIEYDDGKLVMAASQFRFLQAITPETNLPEGSREQQLLDVVDTGVAHEITHHVAPKASEKAVIAAGLAPVVALKAVEGGQARAEQYFKNVMPMLRDHEETAALAQSSPATLTAKLGQWLTPNALKSDSVEKIAAQLAAEYPEADRAEVIEEVKLLMANSDGLLARIGVGPDLRKRLADLRRSKLATRIAA